MWTTGSIRGAQGLPSSILIQGPQEPFDGIDPSTYHRRIELQSLTEGHFGFGASKVFVFLPLGMEGSRADSRVLTRIRVRRDACNPGSRDLVTI